jgi:hypothetical protein
LPSPAVNPANAATVVKDWRRSRPQVVVIDDFLTPEALAALRRFCRVSTIWHRAHPDGYIGAMPEDGFACPLMAQIARELRGVFPEILGPHLFKRLAAFKYDSQFAGLGLHADTAAVNVNFWITENDANLDPQSGGMVIWDVPAPLDWAHAAYNGDAAACRDFLTQTKASPMTVPHRSNRAVIFDSDLFHETDRIVFKPGYLNRRTSISMLYGERGD